MSFDIVLKQLWSNGNFPIQHVTPKIVKFLSCWTSDVGVQTCFEMRGKALAERLWIFWRGNQHVLWFSCGFPRRLHIEISEKYILPYLRNLYCTQLHIGHIRCKVTGSSSSRHVAFNINIIASKLRPVS